MSCGVFGNSQSKSSPSKPYFLATLMVELIKAARLSGLLAILEKVFGLAVPPPMDRKVFAYGVLVWRVVVKFPIH